MLRIVLLTQVIRNQSCHLIQGSYVFSGSPKISGTGKVEIVIMGTFTVFNLLRLFCFSIDTPCHGLKYSTIFYTFPYLPIRIRTNRMLNGVPVMIILKQKKLNIKELMEKIFLKYKKYLRIVQERKVIQKVRFLHSTFLSLLHFSLNKIFPTLPRNDYKSPFLSDSFLEQ